MKPLMISLFCKLKLFSVALAVEPPSNLSLTVDELRSGSVEAYPMPFRK